MDNSVLHITSKNKKCLGTGFVIDKDEHGIYVATCGHVINNCGNDILIDEKNADVIENHYKDGLDLAVLYVKGLNLNPLSITNEKSAKTVKVIGYSELLGNPKREPINNISIKYDIEVKTPKNINAIKLYPREAISKGYSGSPVICQDTNEVIGIVNIQAGKDTNYAISSEHLLDIYTIEKDINKPKTSKIYKKIELKTKIEQDEYNIIKNNFIKKFEKSLQSFSGLPKLWIKPLIHTKPEESNIVTDSDSKINLADILLKPSSLIIKARQQYGLTCLSHYFIKEAWLNDKPSLWLYLDAKELKPHTNEIKKVVLSKLENMNLSIEDIECVILDEFSTSIKDADKIFNKVSSFFDEKPIVVMLTQVDNPLLDESVNIPEDRDFNTYHMWALPRNDIREVVSQYNDTKYIGEEDDVINKIVSDLEVLNIPRTALNCLTILKISEAGFDDSPVNRTEMLGRVLSLLFNVDHIPQYKTRPDLKDTEFVLGYFCEMMLKEEKYFFTREKFLNTLNNFCKTREIDLDIDSIFDVLYKNNIIVQRGQEFSFKFSYWIFYFAAQRMHKNKEFATFILQDMNYTAYPELIEFYTGIDRQRDDALEVLIEDINNTKNTVETKCGLPSNFNIYDMAQWKPTEEKIEKMHEEVSEGVLESNLPTVVKDQYADKSYNRARPLNQSIHKILEDYSLLRLMKGVQAGSKALRNSDHASPENKHKLLQEILSSWEQITKNLLVLAPMLAKEGYATLEGASFVIDENSFSTSPERRLYEILEIIPTNVVDWYMDDLYSKKMTSLIFNHIKEEDNNLRKHMLNLFIIHKKIKGWSNHIEEYIESENKNSYYLLGVYTALRAEYQYSFSSDSDLKAMEKLIKLSVAKHKFGVKKLTKKALNDVDKKFKNVIPERHIKD